MDEWAELDSALSAMAAAGSAEVREDGEWLAELSSLRCELRHQGKNPLVHLWSDQRNLTRHILGVTERSADRIVLKVQRFGRAKPGCLEFLRTDSNRSPARITRSEFRVRIARFLAERFPDAIFEGLTSSPDLEHSFSGLYVRGRMREGRRLWAMLAISPTENAAAVEGMLAFGILWLDWTRNQGGVRAVEGLRLFVPEGMSRSLRERALALSPAARTEIFEFNEVEGRMRAMDLADSGNLDSRLVPRRDVDSALATAQQAFARVLALVLNHVNSENLRRLITSRVSPGTSDVVLCFRGLEFARYSIDGVSFGVGDSRQRLNASTERSAEKLIRRLDLHRNSLASETNHFLYRAAPERWLETLVFEDPCKLNAQLDSRFLYSQVPALAAGDRGILDLLGVTRRGRLVVIELKASEDIQMPFQAVDYWLRVRRLQREGDLQRHGYFTGIELAAESPLVWLVAPGLRFHSATDTLLKYLSPEIVIRRIGLTENWRCSVKVIFRQ